MGCRDSVNPERPGPPGPGAPAFARVGTGAAFGAIGSGTATPGSDRQTFDFDVTDTSGGRLRYTDFAFVRANGSVVTLTADSAADPATGITAFTQTSAACARFGGRGREDSGELAEFTVDACDNGSPGVGVDFFGIAVPTLGYSKSGTLTDGDITLSGGTTPPGGLAVTTSTSGSNLDPDGYTVTVDGTTRQPIATNGSVTFTGLAEADHRVALSGVAANCTVSAPNPRTVSVPAGTAATTFAVTCDTLQASGEVVGKGQLGIGSATPGSYVQAFDFDVRADLTGRFTATDYSDIHTDGRPASLTTDPSTDPATSITAYRNTSSACSDPSSGAEFDAVGRENEGELVGYTVEVCDNGPAGSGTDFWSVVIPSEGYRRSGNVTSGDIVKSRPAPPATGSLTVTTSTTGSSLDPDGYAVTVDGTNSQAIPIDGSVTFTSLAAGSHSVALSGVAATCAVSSPNPQTVTVPSGGAATVSYTVSCTTPNQPPSVDAGPDQTVLLALLYTLSTSFSDPNGDGPWSYTITWGDGSSSSGSTSNQGSLTATHTYLLLGTYQIGVTVTDSHGASGSDTKVLTVIL